MKTTAAQDPDIDLVKRRLRLARSARRFSQIEAAELAGISRSVLVKYEARHNTRIPNTRQMFRLAELYGMSIDFLLGRTSESGRSSLHVDHSDAPSSARKMSYTSNSSTSRTPS